jgi:ribosomal protein L36
MNYIIKSTINKNDLSDINHDIVTTDYVKENLLIYFETYVKDISTKYKIKRMENKIVYEDGIYIITVQTHEHIDNGFNDFDDFADNDDEDIESFLNFQPDMNPEEVVAYMERVMEVTNKNKMNCDKTKEEYNKIVKRNSVLMSLCNEKPLTLKF